MTRVPSHSGRCMFWLTRCMLNHKRRKSESCHTRSCSSLSVVALFALLVVPAYATTPEPEGDAAVEGVEMTVTEPITVSATVAEPLRIVYIPKNTGNPYFDSIINGFTKASEELGYEFTTVAPSTAEGTGQIPFIKEQVQRGVNAIAISPNDPDAVVPALKQAMGKGIRVVCVNSDMNKEGREVAVLPMDFEITGSSQVELLGSVIDYEGEIAILSATTTAPDQNYWIEGMKEALKDPKYAKMNLVKIAYGDDTQKSLTEAEALLTASRICAGSFPDHRGRCRAAQADEMPCRRPRSGRRLGTPNQMRRFLKNNTITKFALWSPYDEGYSPVYDLRNVDRAGRAGRGWAVQRAQPRRT